MTWISLSRGSSPRRARSCGSGMLRAPGTDSTASSGGLRTSSRNPCPVPSQWTTGMSPRRRFPATMPAKFTGSFALPNGGA